MSFINCCLPSRNPIVGFVGYSGPVIVYGSQSGLTVFPLIELSKRNRFLSGKVEVWLRLSEDLQTPCVC